MRKSGSKWLTVLAVIGTGSPVALLAHEVPAKVPKEAKERQNPLPRTEETVQAGKSVYVRLCLSCHGASGGGDGPKAKSLHHRPPDFAKVLHGQTDGDIFWKTSKGGGAMPSYGKKLSEEERWQLIHFLRTVGAPGEGHGR